MKQKLLKLIFFFCLAQVVFPQNLRDSLNFVSSNYQPSLLRTNYNKQITTYNYNLGFSHLIDYQKWKFGISNNFNSTVLKTTDTKIRDENTFSFLTENEIREGFSPGLLINYDFYSDDRSLAINDASKSLAAVFLKFEPIKNFEMIPFAGLTNNKQVGIEDDGYIYGAETLLRGYETEDLIFSGSLKFQNEDILPRRNLLRNLNLNMASKFGDGLSNDVTFRYSEARKDFYFEADSITQATYNISNNIQSRTEDNYSVENEFSIEPENSNTSFGIFGSAGWRTISRDIRYALSENTTLSDFDTNIEEFRLDLGFRGAYSSRNLRIFSSINISEKEEKHSIDEIEGINRVEFTDRESQISRKNNTSQIIKLSVNGMWQISDRNKINFSILQRKLRYDTPSDENFDDRDELLTIVGLKYTRELTPMFDYYIGTDASLSHLVYIYSEKSSNNNRRRVLKLYTGGDYHGKKVSSQNQFEVSANYTVYDFEDIRPNLRSYMFRQFSAYDSTNYKIFRDHSIRLYTYVKFSEQGSIIWSDFSSTPERFVEEIYFEPKYFITFNKLDVGAGIKYFRLTNYNYTDGINKDKLSEYRSMGPVADISLYTHDISLKILGWYEFINTLDNKKKENLNINIRTTWKI